MFFNALATVIAEVEGLDTATVINLGQAARTAGFISKASRGPGAAHMNWADAANLLIAVNASPTLREVPATIERFRAFSRKAHIGRHGMLEDVATANDFGTSLELLLKHSFEQIVMERTLFGTLEPFAYSDIGEAIKRARGVVGPADDAGEPTLSLKFLQRERRIILNIGTEDDTLFFTEWSDENSSRQGDLEVTASITGDTLRKIAKAIGRNEEDR